jgi:uncharacterized repeat protein (TIGR01451 family)
MKSIARPIPATGRTALAVLASISLLLALLVAVRPASATDGAQLNPSHVGTSWDDAGQNASCPEEDLGLIAEGEVLWHFVLTQPSGDEATLTAEFETEGTVTVEDADKPSTTLHFYVVTGPDTLLGASTDISGGNLNLSHICNKVTDEEPPPTEGAPDVTVTKSAEVDGQPITSIAIGDSYDYVLTVTNIGDATAVGVVVNDNLDDELTIDGISATQGTCAVTDAENNHVSCDLGDLDAGASAEVTINVTATLGASGNPICRSPVDNESTVSAENEAEEQEGNNTSNTVVVEIDCAEVGSLKVRKVDEDDNRLAGAVFTVEGQEGTFTTDANGEFCITGLPFGEILTVTEIMPPPGFEIVGEASQEVPVDPDGDCDSPEAIFVNRPEAGGEEGGSLEIRKETNPDGSAESFAFTASYEAAGFALTDGGAFGPTDLEPGDYTVAEVLTQAQIDAGWSLAAIECSEDAVIDLAAGSATVTIDAGDAVVCTFENELEGEGVLGGTPRPTPREGTAGGVPDTATPSPGGGSPIGLIAALAMLLGLSVTTLAAARARAR